MTSCATRSLSASAARVQQAAAQAGWHAEPRPVPVTALTSWLALAGITTGPVFRPVGKKQQARNRPLPPESINALVQAAVTRAGLKPGPYSAHGLRAGFVTYAHLRGASDLAIATRPGTAHWPAWGDYARIPQVWTDDATTQLGL
jgi:integrase